MVHFSRVHWFLVFFLFIVAVIYGLYTFLDLLLSVLAWKLTCCFGLFVDFQVFGRPVKENFSSRQFSITHSYVQVGNSFLERREHCSDADFVSNRPVLRLLHHSLAPLSALMKCIEMNWMAILVSVLALEVTAIVIEDF